MAYYIVYERDAYRRPSGRSTGVGTYYYNVCTTAPISMNTGRDGKRDARISRETTSPRPAPIARTTRVLFFLFFLFVFFFLLSFRATRIHAVSVYARVCVCVCV